MTRKSVRYELRTSMGVLADLVRLVALASMPISLLWVTTESALRFLLIFAVLLAPRFIGVPRPFDAAYGATLLLAAWASSLHWYVGYDDTIGDLTMDGVGSFVAGLALVAWAKAGFGVGRRSQDLPRGRDPDAASARRSNP